jgi:cyclic beta-1,2-glucan synthetase
MRGFGWGSSAAAAGLRQDHALQGALLAPGRGALQPPIRDELLGSAGFSLIGHSLALQHGAPVRGGRATPFFPRLRENIAVLHEAHRAIAQQERNGRHVSPAGVWLLDNIHLVVAQTREVHDGLPRRYFRGLPVLSGGPWAGLPRVYAIAWSYVAHADSAFEPALLIDFLRAYQVEHALTQGELWALPTTLRVVLVENLRRLAERVAAEEAAREAAHTLCDGLDGADPEGPLPDRPETPLALFARLRARGVLRTFALQVTQRLHADTEAGSARGAATREALRRVLADALPEPAAAQADQQAMQAADNLSVGNAIRSLQLLGSADWRGLIAQASGLMRALLAWPPFAAERDDTQDTTLHAIERLARRSRRSEQAVAATLLGLVQTPLAADACGSKPPHESLGYWLQGEGARTTRRALGLWPGWAPRSRARVALPLLLGTLGLGSAALVWGFLHGAMQPHAGPLAWALVALLALWPASETVIAALNRLISESVPPRRLPRLALASGIPIEHRVLVVLPALLSDTATIAALAQRLEHHHLANREAHAQFALLTDHADADSAQMPADAALLAAAMAAIDALETRHGNRLAGPGGAQRPAATRRFLLLHRERQWCASEQRWIGWERKRGKLEQLVALLADAPGASPLRHLAFTDLGVRSQPAPGTPYIVTLDSDTVLPPGALRELVGIAAHPLNRPRIDSASRRVVAGHGILQPRIVAAWPRGARGQLVGPGQATAFHRLFAGASGSDPYNAVASEVYQDLFNEGSFTGKGLLNVAAMQAVLAGRLPEDQVLSHDLLEGCLARCGSVSDVAVVEPAPDHADVAAARTHRWTRGDWQLLPLLAQARHYGLGAIARWKLLDNLRRSLVAPAALLLLIAGLAGAPVSPWAALALAAAAFGAGPLVGAITGLAPSRDDLALRHFMRQALAELGRTLLGLLWQVALWLRQSLLLLDAVARALWRTQVSRRGLLQWTTAAASEAAALHSPLALLRAHADVTLAAAALAAALLALGTPAPGLTLVLCALWLATPLWIALASRPGAARAPLATADADYLRGVAQDTWAWFAQHVNAASHHLPPDNVQTVPRVLVAERTSPTNIGLYLLSLACARSFGWVTAAEMADRLQATLTTLDSLPRERGHFMNWIDTRTLHTLAPAYVSAVDSGNLCGHLLAVATACDEAAQAAATGAAGEPWLQARLGALALRCRHFAEAADFAFLYDTRRRLLHIGWRVAEQQLDAGHYDLLASESRLASLWAIAKGDLPATHWAALGRPFQATVREVGLRSWSGSMFEYLMPALVLDEPRGSVLACASHMAVEEQRDYARGHHVPWGVSESAYAAADRTLAYQYAPQGVPRLALRRTPPDERVVAPYASALAALVEPRAAVANLRRLQALDARGPLGFIEALDYTASRQADTGHAAVAGGLPFTPVCTGMAHHQGMTLVALADVLLHGQPRRWAMADARLAAVACLLQERVPREVARLKEAAAGPLRGTEGDHAGRAPREVLPGANALQRTQMMANGRYSVTLRANGAGRSRLGDVDISRSRDDALRDAHGSFVYLRRSGPGGTLTPPVSLTQHPAADPAAHYAATFHADRVMLDATWADLRSRITVWVSPEDDIELRRVELWNTSARPITLVLLSAFEASLSPPLADEMHPAFANLFISADWDATDQALYLARKPRRDDEAGLHAVHFLAHTDTAVSGVRACADRAQWLGRLREAWQPLARFDAAETATGAVATGLDPVAALSLRLTLAPHSAVQLTLATAAAPERATLAALVDRYRLALGVERSSQLSATLANLRQREQRLGGDERVAVQTLTTLLVQLHVRPSVPTGLATADADEAVTDRRLLWRFGISGDRPLIVVQVSAPHGLRLVSALVQALLRWAWGGVACDLVLINAEPRSYLQPLQRELLALCERHASDAGAEAPACAGGLFLLHDSDVTPAERMTLALLARVRLNADGRPLTQHVADLVAWHDTAQAVRDDEVSAPLDHSPPPAPGWRAPGAEDSDGSSGNDGSFNPENGAYAFSTSISRPTPRPWVNVLTNPAFGAMVSEAGAGCTWAGNSRLFQLTPWSNDPLADNRSERFWVQDLRSREAWNLGAGLGGASGAHRVEHAPGCSTISHRHGDIEWQCSWRVEPGQAVKRVHLRLRNHGTRSRALRVVGLLDWVLGAVLVDRQSVRTALVTQAAEHSQAGATGSGGPLPAATAQHPTQPERRREPRDDGLGVPCIDTLLATQLDDHDGLAGHTAFVTLQRDGADCAPLRDWTCDRRELFDSRGRCVLPDQFGQRAGGGSDPCAALSLTLQLQAGGSDGCSFAIGHGATRQAALDLARWCALPAEDAGAETTKQASPRAAEQSAVDTAEATARAVAPWQTLLGAVTVQTPDPLFDALVNHWLLYQTTACRLWGRAGFYQAGGAYGFRDQLQDAMALAVTAPQLLRAQVLRAAGRQFAEGDVQHWWHPHSGAGVRTHFSDDLLWLPHVALHYVDATDDAAVWDERVPFIEGDPVPEGAEDLYSVPREVPAADVQHATLYEHCARTLDRSLAVGRHGLPLMGGGDWNDGMNRVGMGGQGESVWLAWFLWRIITDFAPVAAQRGEHERAERWRAAAQVSRAALQGPAWDGAWFKRAFFDDGTPLGSSSNAECRIDLIAQAWSVLSGAAPLARQRTAMASAGRLLGDTPHGLLRLLDPPLQFARPSAGYIQAYPPGVRENGGQYNHGAAWAVMAWAQLGQADAAWRAWIAISPAHRAARLPAVPVTGGEVEQPYGLEPYAVAADIYSQPPYTGRGGWSWYTGSAGALHRAAVGSICGLQVQGGRVRLQPALPSHWPAVQITLRRDGRAHRFSVCAATAHADIATALAQGAHTLHPGEWLTLAQAGDHSHHLVIGQPGEPRPAALTTLGETHELGPH